MNQIEKLLAEHCPDGVEHKPLAEVTTYTRGVTYSKTLEDLAGSVFLLRANNINAQTSRLKLDDVKRLKSDVRIRQDQYLKSNDILISAASGSKAHVGKVAFITEDTEYAFGGFMAVIRSGGLLEPRFLFHLLTSTGFQSHITSILSSSTINNLTAKLVGAFLVPIPPIKVQQAIVDILDKMEELERELERELELRKKQYEHYRDTLLSFSSTDAPPPPMS